MIPVGDEIPVCCICECAEGEEGRHLEGVLVEGTAFMLCQICTELSTRYLFNKCRRCGAVGTIHKYNTPFLKMSNDGNCAILFMERCNFCSTESEKLEEEKLVHEHNCDCNGKCGNCRCH